MIVVILPREMFVCSAFKSPCCLSILRFRERYHPRVKEARETEMKRQLRERLNAFVNLLNLGRLDNISLDYDRADQITKLMDASMFLFLQLLGADFFYAQICKDGD